MYVQHFVLREKQPVLPVHNFLATRGSVRRKTLSDERTSLSGMQGAFRDNVVCLGANTVLVY